MSPRAQLAAALARAAQARRDVAMRASLGWYAGAEWAKAAHEAHINEAQRARFVGTWTGLQVLP